MAVAWKIAFWEGGVDKPFLLKRGQGETKPTGPERSGFILNPVPKGHSVRLLDFLPGFLSRQSRLNPGFSSSLRIRT